MSDAATKRRNLEKQALGGFERVARHYTDEINSGHANTNKIAKLGRSSFQFGDLRVNTPDRHIILETESAGGATNLVKYWYCLKEGFITKPIHLFHIFAQSSENDYIRHLQLCEFLSKKMKDDLGSGFSAKIYGYHNPEELKNIVDEFEQILKLDFCI